MNYDAPSITDLGSLAELTLGEPGLFQGNDFLYVSSRDNGVQSVEAGVGDQNIFGLSG